MSKLAAMMRNGAVLDHTVDMEYGKKATSKRMLQEYRKRLRKLTPKQLELLAEGDLLIQKKIALLSVCKTYDLIRDFVIEVVRDKFLIFDPYLSEGDYLSFIRRKVDLHPELETITDKTHKKIKQVIFLILEQAGIIDNIKSKIIQAQYVEPEILISIIDDNPNWLKIFLMSDRDIKLNVENS